MLRLNRFHPIGLRKERAFSLVEVVLSIALAGFALISLCGATTMGLCAYRQSLDIGAATHIANGINAQLSQTAQTNFTSLAGGSTTSSSFDDLGNAVSGSSVAPIYQASVVVAPSVSPNLLQVEVTISRPGGEGNSQRFCYTVFNQGS
jgi:uncharacterized protein (TIGR02598 family)